jgi:hypothetical protein
MTHCTSVDTLKDDLYSKMHRLLVGRHKTLQLRLSSHKPAFMNILKQKRERDRETDVELENTRHCCIYINYLCLFNKMPINLKTDPNLKQNFLYDYFQTNMIYSGHNKNISIIIIRVGARGSIVVKALCYKPEDRGLDSR